MEGKMEFLKSRFACNRSATDTCNRCLQVSLVELHLVWKTRMSLQVAKMKELLLEEAAA